MSDWNRTTIDEFRANGGRVGGHFDGASLLLLHSFGARTGVERVNPLMYLPASDGAVAVFASKAGAPTNPDWYHNLLAHPLVVAEIGTDRRHLRARIAEGSERERLLSEQRRIQPMFADYEAKTTRPIPVVVLEPLTNDETAIAEQVDELDPT